MTRTDAPINPARSRSNCRRAVTTAAMNVADERVVYGNRPLPDLLAYLQNETELTRSTIARILKESGRGMGDDAVQE